MCIIIIIIIISPIWLKTLHSSLTSWFSDQEEKGKSILTFWFQEHYCCRRSLRFWGISSDSSRTGILDTLHSTHFGFIWNVSHCASTSFTCHFNNNSLTSWMPHLLTDFKYSSTRFQSRFVLKRWCTPYKIYSNKSINSFHYFLFLGVFFYFLFALMWEHLAKRKKEMLL